MFFVVFVEVRVIRMVGGLVWGIRESIIFMLGVLVRMIWIVSLSIYVWFFWFVGFRVKLYFFYGNWFYLK